MAEGEHNVFPTEGMGGGRGGGGTERNQTSRKEKKLSSHPRAEGGKKKCGKRRQEPFVRRASSSGKREEKGTNLPRSSRLSGRSTGGEKKGATSELRMNDYVARRGKKKKTMSAFSLKRKRGKGVCRREKKKSLSVVWAQY